MQKTILCFDGIIVKKKAIAYNSKEVFKLGSWLFRP